MAMTANALVRARINEKLKEEATDVLSAMGLTVSDVVRIVLTKIAREKALPFEMRIPNAETMFAMRNVRAGKKTAKFSNAADLMKDLNADD